MMWWQNGMGWGAMGWGGWLVMALVIVAFWSLVVWGVVAIFRGSGGARGVDQRPQERDPLQILDDRFARGELDADEYRARRDALRGDPLMRS